MLLVTVVAGYLLMARNHRRYYDSLPSLQLPDSGRIHLLEPQARDFIWMVREFDDHCDVFASFPEFPSFHVWTGKDPLDGMIMSDWMMSISNEQQMAASALLSQHPDACAIYNPELAYSWNNPPARSRFASPCALPP